MRQRRRSLNLRSHESGTPEQPARVSHFTGPFPCFNPTKAQFRNAQTDEYGALEGSASSRLFQQHPKLSRHIAYQWTRRNNRKGRHLLLISPSRSVFEESVDKQYISRRWVITVGILRMLTHFPLWDISYLLALIFFFGSVAWVLDGLLLLAPYRGPDYLFKGIGSHVESLTAFIGTSVFVVSNLFLILEALNEFSGHCGGWTVNQTLDQTDGFRTMIQPGQCQHRHERMKQSLLARTLHLPLPGFIPEKVKNNIIGNDIHEKSMTGQLFTKKYSPVKWRWLPNHHEMRCHYIYDIGFLACVIQLISSLVFYVGSVTRLVAAFHPISEPLSIVFLWAPKFIGSIGFIVSALLFMFETQTHWIHPNPFAIGWHVGCWSLMGGIAFTLSSCFGVVTWSTGAQYQSALATLCGGAAFLIASLLQWFESLQKYTIRAKDFNEHEGAEEC